MTERVCVRECVRACVLLWWGERVRSGLGCVLFIFLVTLLYGCCFFIVWMKLSVELYLFQTFDCEMVVILVTFEGKRRTILDLYVASFLSVKRELNIFNHFA